MPGFRQPVADRADVAIVGGGLIGVMAARALARAGRRAIVIERGIPCAEASIAAAGMLAPQIESHAGHPLLALGTAARDLYTEVAAECAADGHDIGLLQTGIAHLAFDDARAAELRAQVHSQRTAGLNTEWRSPEDLRREHPSLNPEVRGALFAPGDGCVNNVRLCAAVTAQAQNLGVEFAKGEVVEVVRHHGRVDGLRTDLDHIHADWVVIAAGAWSSAIVGLRRGAPVEPVRGQIAAFPWPAGEPAAVLYSDGGYLVPREGEALAGSTMEHVGFVKETTTQGLADIRRGAARIYPSLAGVPFKGSWAGLRPMSPDGLPILGFDPDLPGVIYATGHGRNGILLAPLTGEIVRDLVISGETRWDIAPYNITRLTG